MCQPQGDRAIDNKDLLTKTHSILIPIKSAHVYIIILVNDKKFLTKIEIIETLSKCGEKIWIEINLWGKKWYDEKESIS